MSLRRRIGHVFVAVAAMLGLGGTGVASAGGVDTASVLGVQMSVSGRITDVNTGQGVAGMCVTVMTVYYDSTTTTWATATTAADGTYRATWSQSESASSQDFAVQAQPNCGADGYWQAAPLGRDSYVWAALTPERGQSTATGIDLQTAPAGRIVGRITDDHTGLPISGVSVAFDALQPADPPNATVQEVLTQADGTYLLGGLPAGPYQLVINKTDWSGAHDTVPTRSQIGYLTDVVHHLPVTASDNIKVFSVVVRQTTRVNESIYPTDSIAGRVTDSTTGLPLAFVDAYVWGGGDWDTVGVYTRGVTDALGRYSIDDLGPGTYTVCFGPSATTNTVVTYDSACYKDLPGSTTEGDPVQVDGFGTTVHGIDQGLTPSGSQ